MVPGDYADDTALEPTASLPLVEPPGQLRVVMTYESHVVLQGELARG